MALPSGKTDRASDDVLQRAVYGALARDPAFTAVRAQVLQGEVFLEGEVAGWGEAWGAMRVVREIPGVYRVVSRLAIR